MVVRPVVLRRELRRPARPPWRRVYTGCSIPQWGGAGNRASPLHPRATSWAPPTPGRREAAGAVIYWTPVPGGHDRAPISEETARAAAMSAGSGPW